MFPLIASTVIGIAGSIAGSVSAAKQKREEREAIQKERNTLEDWYQREMATDYLDTSEARQTLSLLRKQNKKDSNRMTNSLVKQGLTPEANVAFASEINQNYGDAVSRISALNTNHKNNIYNQYDSRSRELNREERKLNSVNSDQIGNVITTAGNSLMELYGAGVFSKQKEK